MSRKIIILIASAFLLTGCADGFKSYFKKSANNKWIDTKGFHGGKRQPLYNKKYINLAKKNIQEDNYDDGDDDLPLDDAYESKSPTVENREMYQAMLKADAKRKQRQKQQQSKTRSLADYDEEGYPSLNKANDRINSAKYDDNLQLQQELAEIKELLNETKKDLTKYKCPIEGQKATPAAGSKSPVKDSAGKSSASGKRSNSSSNGKYLSEEDDYKQINSKVSPQENSDYDPI